MQFVPLKLKLSKPFLGTSIGSGFAIAYDGRRWLVTCEHLLELNSEHLSGIIQYGSVEIADPIVSTIPLTDGRSIVRAAVAGQIVDAIAIELRDGELESETVDHDFAQPMDLPAATSPGIRLSSSGPGGMVIQTDEEVVAWYVVAGYPGGGELVCAQTAEIARFDRVYPWTV